MPHTFAAEQVIVRHALAGVVLTAVLSSASHIARADLESK